MLSSIVVGVQDSTVVNNINIAFVALNIFDYCLTFHRERRRIWKQDWTLVTWMYAANRYVGLMYSFVILAILATPSPNSCLILLQMPEVALSVIFVAHGVLSALRIRAVSGGVFCPLAILVLDLTPFPILVLLDKSVQSAFPFPVYHCMPQTGLESGVQYGEWVLLNLSLVAVTLAEIIVLCSTWKRTFHIYRETSAVGIKRSLCWLLLRDGTIYFVTLLIINLIQIMVTCLPQYATDSSINSFIHWQSLFPLLNCRFLLDLRQISDKPDIRDRGAVISFSKLQFKLPFSVLGNLGEALEDPFDMDQAARLEPEADQDDTRLSEVRSVSGEGAIQTIPRSTPV